MDQVRYGIIGYGKIGSQHVKKILEGKVPSLKLCAVADTDPARIQAAKEALGDSVQYFDTAQALMDSGAVDAVHICTPHYLHPSLAVYSAATLRKSCISALISPLRLRYFRRSCSISSAFDAVRVLTSLRSASIFSNNIFIFLF